MKTDARGKSYADLVRERGNASARTKVDDLADELFKGGILERHITCTACRQRNRVVAGKGSARCAKCGFPLGAGTPRKVHEAMMDAPHDGEPYRQARAAMKAMAAEMKPAGKRSLWRRAAHAWRVFWGDA